MERYILTALRNNGLQVDTITNNSDSNNYGLLHEPIQRYTAYTNIGVVQLVVKTENIQIPPEHLFKEMYVKCSTGKMCDSITLFDECCDYLSMKEMPQREYLFYRNHNSTLHKFVPKVWDCIVCDDKQIIIMEDLSCCININKINSPEVWNLSYLLQTMKDLANIHYELLSLKNDISHKFDFDRIANFLSEFHNITAFGCGIRVDKKVYDCGNKFIRNIRKYEDFMSKEIAVIHNDFNIRNICVSSNKENIKVFDWEFLDIGCPMFDIVDFLLSISPQYININTIDEMLDTYILSYFNLSGVRKSRNYYLKLLYYSALKYSATRMNMYLLCYREKKLHYIERMYCNLRHILELLE